MTNRNIRPLLGVYTALVTPFTDGKLDEEAFYRLLEKQRNGGVEGVVIAGCTGEAAVLSKEERRTLLRIGMEYFDENFLIVAGTGTNCTESTIELTRDAEDAGADAAMLICPYYNKPTQKGLIEHFNFVAEATEIPLILYNVPGRTGIRIEPETIKALFESGRFIAVKEAGGSVDVVSNIISIAQIDVLSGDDSLTLPMISVGAKGVVSVASNVFPEAVGKLVRLALKGDFLKARRIHYELLPVIRSAFIETNPAPVKAMLSHMGLINNELRKPLVTVAKDHEKTITEAIVKFQSSSSND